MAAVRIDMSAGILVIGFFLAQVPASTPAVTAPPAVVSATPTTSGGTSASGSGYTAKDAASNGLSLFALIVSMYALRRNIAQGQRTQLLTRLQRSIKELDEKSFALIESLEKNLLGDLSVHRKCSSDWKILQSLEKDLERHIPCRSEEVFRAVQSWHQVAMSDPYPVQKPDCALQSDSAHLEKVRIAQDALHAYLISLEDGCILGHVKYWKRRKQAKNNGAY